MKEKQPTIKSEVLSVYRDLVEYVMEVGGINRIEAENRIIEVLRKTSAAKFVLNQIEKGDAK
jgi:hypothetical protein